MPSTRSHGRVQPTLSFPRRKSCRVSSRSKAPQLEDKTPSPTKTLDPVLTRIGPLSPRRPAEQPALLSPTGEVIRLFPLSPRRPAAQPASSGPPTPSGPPTRLPLSPRKRTGDDSGCNTFCMLFLSSLWSPLPDHLRTPQTVEDLNVAFKPNFLGELLIELLPFSWAGGFRDSDLNQTIEVEEGDDVTLQGRLEPPDNLSSYTFDVARLDLDGDVHGYRNGKDHLADQMSQYKNRTHLNHEALVRRTVMLTISSVTLSDSGSYKVYVPDLEASFITHVIVVPKGQRGEAKRNDTTTTRPPATDPGKCLSSYLMSSRQDKWKHLSLMGNRCARGNLPVKMERGTQQEGRRNAAEQSPTATEDSGDQQLGWSSGCWDKSSGVRVNAWWCRPDYVLRARSNRETAATQMRMSAGWNTRRGQA
ncbi:uncharacterized protein LOC117951993 [Etheostoma cragini]|uniref:uncharacterized protein LOC117951993 n=1 Tax=Etheostoma cragini TaxID=417921 RepID=UPI00155E4B1A|nr:uncharacterized protein LOC117951993 [Etheostoma cragini]